MATRLGAVPTTPCRCTRGAGEEEELIGEDLTGEGFFVVTVFADEAFLTGEDAFDLAVLLNLLRSYSSNVILVTFLGLVLAMVEVDADLGIIFTVAFVVIVFVELVAAISGVVEDGESVMVVMTGVDTEGLGEGSVTGEDSGTGARSGIHHVPLS